MEQQTINKFQEIYCNLLAHDLQQRLKITSESALFDDADAMFLMRVSSCLALDSSFDDMKEGKWKQWVYDVATRLVESRGTLDSRYRIGAELILARIGNFPGREFLKEKYSGSPQTKYPPILAIETLVRETENTVGFKGLGYKILTDFQVKLIECLRRSRCISVSAPTSAGKSYILSLDIVSSLADHAISVVVYLVPTRALIRQVISDLLSRLREANMAEVAVSGAPVPLDITQYPKGVIYVLTQERLMSLLYSPEGQVKIDRIYIDEAQEIGDEDRGMILHSAVREVIKRFPDVNICFASPLTSNPGYLLNEFEITSYGEFFTELQAPVAQMVVILDEIRNKRKSVNVNILTPYGQKFIGSMDISFEFRGVNDRLANTAVLVTKDEESTIIYANGPADAIDIALKVSVLIDEVAIDPEVQNLIDFVKTNVNSLYALVETLPKGVAFHYGKMPHIIRSQVEDLLRCRKIKYVVSTSTLLQGINLPAKNIVILNPRTGSNNPMKSPTFWNLAGRAGRLKETFNGNIWCINPGNWEENPLSGAHLSEVKSAFRGALENKELREELIAVLDKKTELSTIKDQNRVEQVLGKVFAEFTCQSIEVSNSQYASDSDIQDLKIIDTKCAHLLNNISIPKDVCRRNSSISPLSLNELWKRFQNSSVRKIIPLDPNHPSALERMRIIFQTIDEIFMGNAGNRYKYFAPLAFFWIQGQSLKVLIDNHLEYYKVKPERDATNRAIREFLEGLEQTLRFKYVKYLKAYNDTLAEYLTSIQQENLKASIAPLHVYIEYGARDMILVMLMSLGLSRSTAIFIRNAISQQQTISRDECWNRLNNLQLDQLKIPEVCKSEIRQLIGTF